MGRIRLKRIWLKICCCLGGDGGDGGIGEAEGGIGLMLSSKLRCGYCKNVEHSGYILWKVEVQCQKGNYKSDTKSGET